ncbi:GGDEF domain-containing protein [Pseudoalteromonas sp. S3178]|uniref:sensor domain-containing protein n=1 Tax=Pseudoalteromonas sp. S3178 TaxID=579532 RepID=UPI00110B474F|nr:bifunctional diguanylate cyclase/phosphodiesterase [Pseudoalteromonas sp. S3178]TMP02568.1 GGDEF domain-containing protein [Pseudoalteromonas sp. S3178]
MTSDKVVHTLTHKFVINDPLHQLFDAVEAISVQGYDEQRQVIYWNKGSELLYGYSAKEAAGQKLEDLIIPHTMREGVINAHTNWLNNDEEIPAAELNLTRKNGSMVCVYSSHVMFINQYNNKQMYCIDIDLTDVKKAQGQAVFKQKMLETIFEAIPDLFFLMQEDGTIVDFHASNNSNLYANSNELIGKNMFEVLPDEIATKFKINIAQALKESALVRFEYELKLPHGLVYFEARLNHVSQYKQVMIIVRDITEQHKSDELIRKQAFFDSLTLLPNRFLALEELSKILLSADANKTNAAVCFLDLDDFKKINDSLGHEIGDQLLIEAAERLKQVLNKTDLVGRLGGDEFIVVLQGLASANSALRIVDKVLKSFRKPFKVEGRELIITLSVGVAMYPENGSSASDLLKNADTAMYQAKGLGRNTYSFFTKQMNEIIKRRFYIEEQMHSALQRNEFELYFQPQVEAKSNQIIGAEALLRWHNPKLGNISPDEFIPIAEHTGLIVPIGKYVIEQALKCLSKWHKAHKKSYSMAVNLSPSQFRDPKLLSYIKSTLKSSNVEAKYLELEITEGVLMSGQANIITTLVDMTELGITLSMDDFGTGYSSLNYLREYPFNVLKIDRSFISGITQNKEDCNLVKGIIAMSHSLGLSVVAEGVESKEQLLLLKQLECYSIQGYYFSKPLPAAQLFEFST